MKEYPTDLVSSIARHYCNDASDFLARFDHLWEHELHKTGRIKSFVDLLMGCECVLKAHILLGGRGSNIENLYKRIRSMGHKIDKLAEAASFMDDRSLYEHLKHQLGPFSVFVRYSLDAYETFFPSLLDREDASINYSNTIGNNNWVLGIRDILVQLLAPLNDELCGIVNSDLAEIIEYELKMKEFVEKCMK